MVILINLRSFVTLYINWCTTGLATSMLIHLTLLIKFRFFLHDSSVQFWSLEDHSKIFYFPLTLQNTGTFMSIALHRSNHPNNIRKLCFGQVHNGSDTLYSLNQRKRNKSNKGKKKPPKARIYRLLFRQIAKSMLFNVRQKFAENQWEFR